MAEEQREQARWHGRENASLAITNPLSFLQKIRGELGSGQGVTQSGQIRFVPQKVSTSRRFLVLVLVASVTCHLMPNATMSTWEVPVASFPSAPDRTQRSTRGRSWVLHP